MEKVSMTVKARIVQINWTDPRKPTCLVALSNKKLCRIFRMKIKDVPNCILKRP